MPSANALHSRLRAIAAAIVALVLSCAMVLANVDLDRMERLALSRHGPNTAETVVRWRALISEISTLGETEKVERVNSFFNNLVRWRTDIEVWRQNDYWATPLETMARREGDCEDFSIAKYMTLLLAGVDVGKMRVTYVKAQIGGAYSNATEAHMVLAYYPTPSADPLILDNMISEVRPASRRPDLTPVFGFNSQGLWVGGAAAPATRDPGARLSRWRDLLQRMAADGLG
ncbi:transglutaminase-like cysteine peptidase [Haliea sp. E1-2-M8]|uniref:transglutaminase-like cysteine peptidase n=1 Tax=Haliea sp. E1-2-M8 TaxID=3064706 RepID=UPI0027291070|nr:transglutaminase-like cysteine peptidase [Haliea sp. E1-2-M8]MDO8860513.1 transglutaminase-like cysteine peptidase [Haliea sp. E1-2-M8]